jgi:filamentous hemagglutinin family protein
VGTQAGGNLFESFSQFNLLENQVADFLGPSSIENIIARIAGGASSSIDGTIKSGIQGANLFLIDSAGFLFGSGARLNVSGAFTVSTADSVKLAGGGLFHSSVGAGDMLSAAAVDAFGFSGAPPAPISFFGSRLGVPAGKGLNVIAGNVALAGNAETGGAYLVAPSGGLTIFSASSVGEVPFSLTAPGAGFGSAKFSALGALSVSDSSIVAIDGVGGGSISIRAGTISVDDSAIRSENMGLAPGGDITVQAQGAISIVNTGGILAFRDAATEGGAAGLVTVTTAGDIVLDTGEIASSTFGLGNGGDVRVHAANITISGAGGIFSDTQSPTQGGAAGDIFVNIAGTLILEAGGEISSSTLGLGKGGDITVTAGQIAISGATPDGQKSSGIFAISDSQTQGGPAGNVVVNSAAVLEIEGGGEINSSTFNSGNGGDVTVTAGDILISGMNPDQSVASGIYAESDALAGGAAGSVNVNSAGLLLLQEGGEISSSTAGTGTGGNVDVTAGGIGVFSGGGILSISASSGQGGEAGNVTVNAAGQLEVVDATISSSTEGLGKGGLVFLTALNVTIDDGEVSAESNSLTRGGDAGAVTVEAAGFLDLEEGAEISSSTFGLGQGGDVTALAQEIAISGASLIAANSLSATQGGAAGDVTVRAAGSLDLENGAISSSTAGLGRGGNVTATASDIGIFDSSAILADSQSGTRGGAAGDVTVRASGLLDITGDSEISSSTFGLGHGGNVTVTASGIDISGVGGIFANSQSVTRGGPAGDITVDAAGSLDLEAGAEISSSTQGMGHGGDVTVAADAITISGVAPDKRYSSGIFAISGSVSQGGAAGEVTVHAPGSLEIEDGGQISSSTMGLGNGGDVTVTAGDIAISGPGGIFANSESSVRGGAAGNVVIAAENLALNNGAQVATSALTSNAGDVTIDAVSDLTVEEGSTISSSAGISGGNINLNVGALLYLLDSSITATAGALRNVNGGSNASAGSGGNITMDSEFIVLNQSQINANAAAGQGGNILLEGSYYLNSGSDITATGATSGTIIITSPELDLSGALVGLPSALIGAETQLQETCAMAINGDFSSFLAVGQGDVEAAPDEAQGGSGDGGRELGKRPAQRKPGRTTGPGL